jgi:iron complex outermembrane receptor protein
MILAPEWTLTTGLDWEFLSATWGTVSAHTDSRFTSKAYYDPFNTEATAQDGYSVHDARLTVELASTSLKLSAWIKNLADEEYRVYRLNVAPSFNFDYGQRGRPREYGVELRYSF